MEEPMRRFSNMDEVYHIEEHLPSDYPGIDCPLQDTWVFWYEKCIKKKYIMIPKYDFHTVGGFWCLIHVIQIPKGQRVLFMRDGILPKWEDPHHENGGYCHVDITGKINHVETRDFGKILEQQGRDNIPHHELHPYGIFIKFLLAIVGETFCENNEKITGIIYIDDNSRRQIRLWLSDWTLELNETTISKKYLPVIFNINNLVEKVLSICPFHNISTRKKNQAQYEIYRHSQDKHNNENVLPPSKATNKFEEQCQVSC